MKKEKEIDYRIVRLTDNSVRRFITADDLIEDHGGESYEYTFRSIDDDGFMFRLEKMEGVDVTDSGLLRLKYPGLFEENTETIIEFIDDPIGIPDFSWRFRANKIDSINDHTLLHEIIPSILFINPEIDPYSLEFVRYIRSFTLLIGSVYALSISDIKKAIKASIRLNPSMVIRQKRVLFQSGSVISPETKAKMSIEANNRFASRHFAEIITVGFENALTREHVLRKIADGVILRNAQGIKDVKTIAKHKTAQTKEDQHRVNLRRPIGRDKITQKYKQFLLDYEGIDKVLVTDIMKIYHLKHEPAKLFIEWREKEISNN